MYVYTSNLQKYFCRLWRAPRAIAVAHAQGQTKAPHLTGGAPYKLLLENYCLLAVALDAASFAANRLA